jgi:hypothetical protein
MAGHYFLLRNYLEVNADALPKQVVFVCTPLCLQNDLDEFSYQYFLKPFYTREYKPLFSERLMERVREIPRYWTSRLPFIRVSNHAIAYELDPEDDFELVSPVSREYLREMYRLASSKGVCFSLVCTPLRESRAAWAQTAVDTAERNGELDAELLDSYRGSILAYPDSLFRDERHFLQESIPADPLHLID